MCKQFYGVIMRFALYGEKYRQGTALEYYFRDIFCRL